ncbi:DUF4302 domain-containing protein [Flavisericum labens]|uniref:DUF4302 domain-containing protein n=1 Tax=Flavisericum labens TaxID=3377112 RepID=UPI00387AD04B
MKKIYRNNWLICLALLLFVSCNNDDGEVLFDQSPADRLAEQNEVLLNLLTTEPQGYKALYFSKNDEFGGFTYYMKFNTDGTVRMTSDFDEDTDIQTSSYDVRTGTTTELVFTTRNHIQKVSNPDYPGLVGTGFKGTSVFQFFSEEEGVITFRDVRNTSTGILILTPTNFSDFDTESLASVETSLVNRENFTTSDAVTSFPFLSVENGSEVDRYALNYNNVTLFANPTKQDASGAVTDEEFGIAFTEDGLVISPALEVNGVAFENFLLDDSSGLQYVSVVDGVTAKIGYGNTPVTPLDPYAFGERRNFAIFNDLELEKSSNAFLSFYQDYTAQLESFYGLTINFVYFVGLNDGTQPILVFATNFGNFLFGLDFEVNDGVVVFTDTGLSNTSAGNKAIFQPLIDVFIGGPSGFYLNNTGNLDIYSNRTFSMISVADPTIEINYYDQ